ncbi:MAG: cysteine--tRNA ligase [Candidatus Saccharimonadales bacterium]
MSQLKLHNTLSKSLEDFEPLKEDEVKLFVCGPTVYDRSHIGHAKTYVQMDVLARTLKALGYKTIYLQNITDIDDKIILRAQEEGRDWEEVAREYESAYREDMETLNNTSVDKYAKATDYIDNIINQIQTLLDKGFAYLVDGDGIYFEIAKFKDYGKLSGRKDVQENDARSRIDESDRKRGWNDFCLWKFSKPEEPEWPAPFGSGRPGWHIEDTAITEKEFGSQYDIHGGAIDLIFPHHEAEITQMESISGKKPFVRYWLHSGFLNINKSKMAKSAKNFHTIKDVVNKGYNPMALRLLILQSHYRSSIDFSWEVLDAASNRLETMQAVADLRYQLVDEDTKIGFINYQQKLLGSISQDLDTPKTLSELSSQFNVISNYLVGKNQKAEFNQYLEFIDQLLGLKLLDSADISKAQQQLLAKRAAARKQDDWSQADEIRQELLDQGLEVRDTPAGQIWSKRLISS